MKGRVPFRRSMAADLDAAQDHSFRIWKSAFDAKDAAFVTVWDVLSVLLEFA